MTKKIDPSDKKAGSLWLAFLIVFCGLALTFPGNSEATLASYVKSIEYVDIALSGTTASANLSKSQTIANCVPFVTSQFASLTDFNTILADVYLEAGPKVTAARNTSSGTVNLGVFVVEFDSSKVKVQSGVITSFSTTSSTTTLSSAVVQSKAALVFYYKSSNASSDWNYNMVAGWFSADNTLSWQRDAASGSITGHYYVFEALNSEFSVQAKTITIASGGTSGTASLTSVTMDKTFLTASYRTNRQKDEPMNCSPQVYLNSSTQIVAARYGNDSYTINVNVFAITLAGDEKVQRGSFSFALNDTLKDYTLANAVSTDEAIAWNIVTKQGSMAVDSDSELDHPATFQRLKLVSSGTKVQGDRGYGGSTNYQGGTGRWEVIWFKSQPNAVILSSFSATAYEEGKVLLEWKTGYEASNLGFNIYREEGGRLTRINPELIKGSALMTGPETRTAGYSYSWWDTDSGQLSAISDQQNGRQRSVVGGQRSVVRYYLEDVDLSGAKTMHGPVTPVFSHKPAPKKAQSMLLSQINRQGAGSRAQGAGNRSQEPELRTQRSAGSGQRSAVGGHFLASSEAHEPNMVQGEALRERSGARANIVVSSVDEGQGTLQRGQAYRIPSDRPNATPAVRQKAIAAASSVKIFIQEEGWYRITQPQLVAAGLDPGVNPRSLQLFVDGEEQPIIVRGGSDDWLGPQDSIEFYGTGLDTPFTDTRVYWLVEGMSPGKRIPKIGEDAGDRVSSASFPFTREKKDRMIYLASLRNGDAPNFFGAVVSSTPVNQVLAVSHLASSPPGNAELEVSLQGVSAGAHQVKITVNGVVIGTMVFEGQALKAERFPLVQSGLVEGDNTVTLVGEGLPSDVSLVDYIRLTYWRTYTAEEDSLRIAANGGDFLSVKGFSGPSVRVMDITNPHRVTEVQAMVRAEAGAYSTRFRVPGYGARTLLAFVDEEARNPAALAANQPSGLYQATQGVDVLIISYGLFLESLTPLKTWRESQGLSVAVVDVEDVYDEFSFGTKTPQSLKNFLLHAKSSWQNPPRFVLLVGDASFDPRNFYGFGSFDFMPTKLVDTYYQETASDDWFVDFDQDGLPDMAIGRLPVRTPGEAAAVISKITGYEQSADAMTDVLLVADMADAAGDFPASSRQVEALFPEVLTVTEVFRDQFPDDVQVRNALLSSLNQGPLVVNYMGHGTTQFWRGGIFGFDDAEDLTNGLRLPFFINMTCLNGWFHDPFQEGLAEALLKAQGGGAIAAWASSGLTWHDPQLVMNKELITLLFNGEGLTIGEAVKRAKAATTDADVRRTWILFGDPATRLK